jgi:hypothetical protein
MSRRGVFISHTAELNRFPAGRSFVDAAKDAINRAGDVPTDMSYFAARDQKAKSYCIDQVREADIYLGLIGFCFGSRVRDSPDISYTQLEFGAATQLGKERLVFLLDKGSADLGLPGTYFSDPNPELNERQLEFRAYVRDHAGIVKKVGNIAELELGVYQALRESGSSAKPVTAAPSGAPWSARLLGKGDARWTRDVLLRLSASDHRLTYKETMKGCDIFVDGVKVGDLSTTYSGRSTNLKSALLGGPRAWRRWVIPLLDGPVQHPMILSAEIAILNNKLLSLHVHVGNRLLYSEGNAPPLDGWVSKA